jgi:hypothetical protein
MLQSSTIRERLLTHARLCREIGDATPNEETASPSVWRTTACGPPATPIPNRSPECSTARLEAVPQPPDFIADYSHFLLNQVFPSLTP